MYFIYLDEAGTSQREPVTVMVGVIIHADKHWRAAQNLTQSLYDKHVPAALREGFSFHATAVRSEYRDYDSVWSADARMAFIGEMASIPRQLRAAIALGIVRREMDMAGGLTGWHFWECQQLFAFHKCITKANQYVRDWAKSNQVAIAVAENIPKKQAFYKKAMKAKVLLLPMTEQYFIPTEAEKQSGKMMQTQAPSVDRIVDTLHFVDKADGPLLTIADACAFSFRRYFSGQDGGDNLVQAMLGGPLVWSDWQGHCSSKVFSFDPNKFYPSPSHPVYRL